MSGVRVNMVVDGKEAESSRRLDETWSKLNGMVGNWRSNIVKLLADTSHMKHLYRAYAVQLFRKMPSQSYRLLGELQCVEIGRTGGVRDLGKE